VWSSIHPIKSDAYFEAGQPRPSDDKLRRRDPEAVVDPNVIEQALGGQVLAEDAIRNH
jgi:hypothetical protein